MIELAANGQQVYAGTFLKTAITVTKEDAQFPSRLLIQSKRIGTYLASQKDSAARGLSSKKQ